MAPARVHIHGHRDRTGRFRAVLRALTMLKPLHHDCAGSFPSDSRRRSRSTGMRGEELATDQARSDAHELGGSSREAGRRGGARIRSRRASLRPPRCSARRASRWYRLWLQYGDVLETKHSTLWSTSSSEGWRPVEFEVLSRQYLHLATGRRRLTGLHPLRLRLKPRGTAKRSSNRPPNSSCPCLLPGQLEAAEGRGSQIRVSPAETAGPQ